ncbi:hypothetical protein N7447_007372 [Penicillium robsamsonii]|uniref:uncharacterized protein n=1 Tax=Penicillium robsamsonii TaxID=1792511 RepID=UPI002546C6FE|nr:uncharacterized protein N7447_007372 [Penicillium robsamsonii]KAJ5825032.1 hypothetical protein N7447_007372 [Penicillium robsamsonii]
MGNSQCAGKQGADWRPWGLEFDPGGGPMGGYSSAHGPGRWDLNGQCQDFRGHMGSDWAVNGSNIGLLQEPNCL